MNKSRIGKLAVLPATCALLLSACGSATLAQQSEKDLAKKGVAAMNAGPAKSIDCPSDVQPKVGVTLDCHITLNDNTKVTLTEKIDKIGGDNGHLTIIGAKQS